MKKKLIIISIIFVIVAMISGTLYYFHYEAIQAEEQKEAEAKAKLPKPTNYCLITYQLSSDNGKSWHNVTINSGQKAIYKAQCWKKYIHILDGFKASTDTDGTWQSKTEDGKIIAHPSMHFSDKPFETKDKEQKTSKKPNKENTSQKKDN